MSLIGNVEYRPGWMGGDILIGNTRLEDLHDQPMVANIKGEEYKVKIGERRGSDYDHGHTYEWTKPDLLILIPCPVMGVREESVIRIFKKTKIKKIVIQKAENN